MTVAPLEPIRTGVKRIDALLADSGQTYRAPGNVVCHTVNKLVRVRTL